MATDDPAARVGANDLSLPDLRRLVLPFRVSGTVGPMTVAQLKSDLENEFDEHGFDVACDFGPTQPPIGGGFGNREPGSARHALEGIMVGEKSLVRDRATGRRNLRWVMALIGGGVVLAVLNFTVLGSSVAPLMLFLGTVAAVVGLISLPRLYAFESDVAYVWYGYDPPGWVAAYSRRALERQMPTTSQMFEIHVGAGRVSSTDVRGKGVVGRRVQRVVETPAEMKSVPHEILDRLSASSQLRKAAT